MESIYESNKNWVSVEVVLNKSLTPSELFNLTENKRRSILFAIKR